MIWDFSKYSNKVAVIDEFGTTLNYLQLKKEGDKLAKAVGERCLVFCMCKNDIGSLIGYTSFLNAKIVPIMLNAHLDKTLFDTLFNLYRPSYIWAPSEMGDEFENLLVTYNSSNYTLFKTSFDGKCDLYPELALLLTTSGSTGSPKFVRQSYKNIESNTKSIVQYLNLDDTEKAITTLPMNYTYGLSIINTHLFVGATILLTDKGLMQKEFWNFFKAEGATSFGGVPYTYEMLDKLRFYRMDLPSLRYMTQAGGKILPELHAKFAKYAADSGKKFIVMYGQCEATARMSYLPPEKAIEKCGSMGIVIPGGKFHLIGTNGELITTPYTTGELVYEGENVTLGYAECLEDLAKGDERNGLLQTGDMAQFDEDGYYYIVGRKKRFLKIYGNRVNLDEIDRLLKGHFTGLDCASAGVDDHMYIFITDESLSVDVKEFVSETTRLNPAAFTVEAINEIPKNDSGKVLYKELTKYY